MLCDRLQWAGPAAVVQHLIGATPLTANVRSISSSSSCCSNSSGTGNTSTSTIHGGMESSIAML
jgi:hypothetical protein